MISATAIGPSRSGDNPATGRRQNDHDAGSARRVAARLRSSFEVILPDYLHGCGEGNTLRRLLGPTQVQGPHTNRSSPTETDSWVLDRRRRRSAHQRQRRSTKKRSSTVSVVETPVKEQ